MLEYWSTAFKTNTPLLQHSGAEDYPGGGRRVLYPGRPLPHVQLKTLPTRDIASVSWGNNGEVIIVESKGEALAACDDWAPEHLEVQTADWRCCLDNLTNCGSLFLGEETTVAHGDKSIGTNHVPRIFKSLRRQGQPGMHQTSRPMGLL